MFLSSLFSTANLILGVEVSLLAFLLYCISSAIYSRYFHPYRHFPGPFWATITPLWYWRAVRYGIAKDTQLPLHKKYGDFVRIAPNEIAIMDPAAIETIYGPKTVFQKSPFYMGFSPGISPRHGNFEETDEKKHAIRRRIVAPLYTQGSILEFEPCVDRLIALFYRQMETFEESGQAFDMSVWLRKYTFDVIGEIFYGREGGFGFLRDNIDYNNWCTLMDIMPNPTAAKSYVPWGLQSLFFFSEFFSSETRLGGQGFFDVITQSHTAVGQRLASRSNSYSDAKDIQRTDMLTRLIDLVNSSPDPKVHWTMADVTAEIWTMIWAGSDTTSIALTSIFYHLHKHPPTLEKLRDEIEEALATGRLSYPLRYADCVKLPYLHAVVREGMRMHPSLGTGLPRTVPQGGIDICNHHFPAGGGVIMNDCAVNFHKETFGPDAEEFVPERWERGGKEGAARMERAMLQFGYGPRICIGKNITTTELYKLIPTMLHNFGFEFVPELMPNSPDYDLESVQKESVADFPKPQKKGEPKGADGSLCRGVSDCRCEGCEKSGEGKRVKWTVWGGWFHQQRDVWVRVKRRAGREGAKSGRKGDGGKESGEKVVVDIDESEGGWGRKRNL